MSEEQMKEVFRRVIEEGFSKGDLDALDQCFPPTFEEHQFGLPPTLEGLKRSIRELRAAFPDLNLTIEDVVMDGDKLWARMTARGTHQGPLMGRPPTGKSFTITVIDVCRFEEGKIVEHWGAPDRFAQMHQLGLLPQARQAAA